MKQCSKCKQNKDISEFCKRTSSPDGHGILCVACRKAINILNKERRRRWWKQYYNKHKKVICAKRIVYRLNNSNKIQQTKHKSYIRNKEKIKLKYQNKKKQNVIPDHKLTKPPIQRSVSLSEYLDS